MDQPPKESWWVRYRATLRATFYAMAMAFIISPLVAETAFLLMHLTRGESLGIGSVAFVFIAVYVYTAIKDAPEMKRQW